MNGSGDFRPVPDPTVLTTEQLTREIAHLKELNNLHFDLIERQRKESKADNNVALAAALEAAKEQVSILSATYNAEHEAMTKDIEQLRGRITVVEAVKVGGAQTWSYLLGAAGLVSVILTVVYNFMVISR